MIISRCRVIAGRGDAFVHEHPPAVRQRHDHVAEPQRVVTYDPSARRAVGRIPDNLVVNLKLVHVTSFIVALPWTFLDGTGDASCRRRCLAPPRCRKRPKMPRRNPLPACALLPQVSVRPPLLSFRPWFSSFLSLSAALVPFPLPSGSQAGGGCRPSCCLSSRTPQALRLSSG